MNVTRRKSKNSDYRNNKFLVKWKDNGPEWFTWEPLKNIKDTDAYKTFVKNGSRNQIFIIFYFF